MTAPLFSKEFVRGLALQADNTFDARGDFVLHFCIKGDLLHAELSPAIDDLEEVIIIKESAGYGDGFVQRRFIRHVVPEVPGDFPDEDEAAADVAVQTPARVKSLAEIRGRNKLNG